ncbi:hypothetical protein [Azospirillum sp. B2RO_4]|uniref:hypothetical protein n=1 Tax=Azospirillum sp. B2RO_4 TaxID=3027796 RepID=UPI003DA88035
MREDLGVCEFRVCRPSFLPLRTGADMQDAGTSFGVIPAKAGIQAYPLVLLGKHWIPAFAGMTVEKGRAWLRQRSNL